MSEFKNWFKDNLVQWLIALVGQAIVGGIYMVKS